MATRRRREPAWKADFRQVHPTSEEQADWRAKKGTRFPLPKRVECRSCAKADLALRYRDWLPPPGLHRPPLRQL